MSHQMNATATTGHGSSNATLSSAASAASQSRAMRKYYSEVYPEQVWWFVTGIIGTATLLNLASVYWAWRRRRAYLRGDLRVGSSAASTASDKTSSDKTIDNETTVNTTVDEKGATARSARTPRAPDKVDLRRLPAAALAASRIVAFRWRIPHVSMTVLEAFLTVMYMLGLFLWDFLNTANLNLSYVQSRAANMATAQFPLIVALAMKNNAIQFLTGISHEKLNLMHRVVSRVIFLQIWIHMWGIVARHSRIFNATWRWMGLVAGVSFTILTVLSIKPIRKRFYEFFWITHVIFVMLFLIGALWHTIGVEDGWMHYVWPCFLIWGQDRLCRYARYLILSDVHAPARVEQLSADTLRISARRRLALPLCAARGGWAASCGWKAGMHMFVAFPTLGPLESHPFTIASVCEPLDDGKEGEREFVWIVRTRKGFTRRLREHVLNKDGACEIPIFMDGPYGAPPDITPFETCVFVAGGSGVAYTMPRMRELITQIDKRDACAQRIVFIWAIRHAEHINWIAKDLTKAVATLPSGVELCIQIFVTSRPPTAFSQPPTLTGLPSLTSPSAPSPAAPAPAHLSPTSPLSPTPTVCDITTESRAPSSAEDENTTAPYDDDDATDADVEKASASTHTAHSLPAWTIPGVEVRYGRPDMHALLEDAVARARGPVSVDISGPDPLVAAVRRALSAPFAGPMNILRGGASVQLNVEDFTM